MSSKRMREKGRRDRVSLNANGDKECVTGLCKNVSNH